MAAAYSPLCKKKETGMARDFLRYNWNLDRPGQRFDFDFDDADDFGDLPDDWQDYDWEREFDED